MENKELQQKNNSNKLLIVIIILLSLLVLALGALVAVQYLDLGNELKEETKEEDKQKEIVEITDINTITNLSVKIDQLLSIGKSDNQYHQSNIFSEYGFRYDALENKLTDLNKLEIVLNAIEFENLQGDAWKTSAAATTIQAYSDPQMINENKQLSSTKVNEFSKKLFGKELSSSQVQIGTCPIYIYDANQQMYYRPVVGCGGTSPRVIKVYKSSFKTDGEKAYAYVNAAFIEPNFNVVPETYNVYTSFGRSETNSVVYNGIYKSNLDYNDAVNGFKLDSTNHKDFAEYVFIFKKDSTNNYYFEKVETTKK